MSVGYNPKIVTDGLVLFLDAANRKSYDPAENLISDSEGLSTFSAARSSKTLMTSGGPVNNNKYTILTITDSSGGQYLSETSQSVAAGDYVTQSWYVKDVDGLDSFIVKYWTGAGRAWTVTREVSFQLSTGAMATTGTIIDKSIKYISDGWYRLSMTAIADQAGTAIASLYISNVCPIGNKVWVSSPQLTKKIGPSTYTPTTGTIVTASTSFVDLSGYANSVTMNGVIPFNENQFMFNGTVGNYMSKSTLNIPASFDRTILCWVYPDSTGPSNGYTGLVGYGNRASTTPSDSILLCLNTSASNWYVGSAYWSNDYNPSPFTINKDAWNMVGIVGRGMGGLNNTKLVCANSAGINSVTGSQSNYFKGLSPTNTNLTIGCTDNNGGRQMKGKIAVVLIYNKELSDNEIQQNFNALRGRFNL